MQGNEQSVQFAYAKADDKGLIHILKASRTGRYTCPSCNEPMIPVLSDNIAKHFRHHKAACSYESYLHQTAKIAIYHRLLNEDVVTLKLLRHTECRSSKTELLAGQYEPCKMLIPAIYNLKALFDQVALEQYDAETGFKPDVLLTNAKSNAKCYIEIHVTNPCSKEKIDTGVPILEFHVASEADITALTSNDLCAEDTELTHHNFKLKSRATDRCLEQCHHAKVEIDEWKLNSNGRLQKQTCRYQDIDHTAASTSSAWPKNLASQEQLTRLQNVIQHSDSLNAHANCVNCIYASNWNNGFLHCSKKHIKVPYTEAKLCSQYRPVK